MPFVGHGLRMGRSILRDEPPRGGQVHVSASRLAWRRVTLEGASDLWAVAGWEFHSRDPAQGGRRGGADADLLQRLGQAAPGFTQRHLAHHDLGGGLGVEGLAPGLHQSLGHARMALLVIGIRGAQEMERGWESRMSDWRETLSPASQTRSRR